MKKIIPLLIVFVDITALLMAGCSGAGYIIGSGDIVNKEFAYTDFNNLEISTFYQFQIEQSDSYRVVASTYENVMDFLNIHQSGDTLIVGFKPGSYSKNVKITINMPQLNKLVVSGASTGNAKGFKSVDQLELNVSGASQLDMDVEAGETRMEVSGAGKVTGNLKAQDTRLTVSGASHCELRGSADMVHMEVSGASHIESPDFLMQNTNISLSGASHATIFTRGTLNLEVTGASILDYLGNPILSKVNVSGASKINSR